jgi:hypothetical protein
MDKWRFIASEGMNLGRVRRSLEFGHICKIISRTLWNLFRFFF